MRRIGFVACLLTVVILGGVAPSHAVAEALTLEAALDMAYGQAPALAGSVADVKAAQGVRDQAGAWPNPSLSVEVENIGGSGSYRGTRSAEITAGVSQLIEIGGKRHARQQVADHGKTMAHFDQDAARMDIRKQVTQAFAHAVAAQEQAVIAQEQLKLAKDMYATVSKRVAAAAAPIVQRNKARISLTHAELAAEQAQLRQQAALRMLAAIWGGDARGHKGLASKWFYTIEKPSSDLNNPDQLVHTVDYKRHLAGVEQSRSLIDLEKAQAVPDPSVNVGVRQLRDSNDQALVAGVSFPLPVFNRNTGNIEAMRQQAVKTDTERQRVLFDARARLADLNQQLQSAFLTATKIKKDILPQAQQAFTQAKRGYGLGKFPYLEVLDAQRTLADTRQSYVQALQDYHSIKADIDRLIAQEDHSGDRS